MKKKYNINEFSKFINKLGKFKEKYISKILISFDGSDDYLIRIYISSKCPKNEIDGLYNKTVLKLLTLFETFEIYDFNYEIVMEDYVGSGI